MIRDRLRRTINRTLLNQGYALVRRRPNWSDDDRLGRLLAALKIDLVLDVGANDGHTAQSLRQLGYRGRIVSFEPGPAAFQRLSNAAASDSLWSVRPDAVGEANGPVEFHVSDVDVTSSILSVRSISGEIAPGSTKTHQITATMVRLDDVLSEIAGAHDRILLKTDTQGYDLHVLRGAGKWLSRITMIRTEVSVVPLYEGQPSMHEIAAYLADRNFDFAGLIDCQHDPEHGQLLWADALYINRGAFASRDSPMATLTISVVTPSYNQGRFIERTLLSVLDQDYPALQYIVIDGGSTDASPAIIAKHATRLASWISEKDSGQSNAINKGMARATGEILTWLNSDDSYPPGTLDFVGSYFAEHPDVDAIVGHTQAVNVDGTPITTWRGAFDGRAPLAKFWLGYSMHQPSIFWRRRVFETLGPLDEKMHLTMDYDYWLRMADRGFKITNVDRVLACATVHGEQKTNDNFVGYKRAQLKIALYRFGSPLSVRDWNIRLLLYWHLLKTGVKILLGRPTLYTR